MKIILGNLIEEKKTVSRETFKSIFSYQDMLVFFKIPMLLSLIKPILGHGLSVKVTEFKPLREKHLWDLMLKVVTELILHSYCTTISFPGFGRLVLGLFSVYSDYCYIYFFHIFFTFI